MASYLTDTPNPATQRQSEGILLGDWNNHSKGLIDALEEHFELEWSDEWLQCECGKIFRTSPDCYSWTIYGAIYDGDYECGDCIKANPSHYVEWLLNNPSCGDTIGLDYVALGFEQYNGWYESGWYGREDKPHEILKKVQAEYPTKEFIFGDLSPEQFRLSFKLYMREKP